jgi:DtxR family transcriptional regulator, Mn-dependent transcriptional regulator
MASRTVEDYVKRIYAQQQRDGGELVSLGALAQAMGVVPGTVTTMVKALSEGGLVDYRPRHGVALTAKGEKLALSVLRRHRLLELFLVKALGCDWAEVHEEAESLEHAISDRLIDKVDLFLGRPRFDPHGDPIPSADGQIAVRQTKKLSQCAPGESVTVARVADQNVEFLHFATERGLAPGAKATVLKKDPLADSIALRVGDKAEITLGLLAAGKIWVE